MQKLPLRIQLILNLRLIHVEKLIMAYNFTFRRFGRVVSWFEAFVFLRVHYLNMFSIAENLYSEFVVYRLCISFNGEYGN